MRHFVNEGSPYWNFHKSELDELPEANPDVLADGYQWLQIVECTIDDEENIQAYERVLSKGFLEKLPERQKLIWKLFIEGFRVPEIAKYTTIDRRDVYRYLRRIGKKLKTQILKERHLYYEEAKTKR